MTIANATWAPKTAVENPACEAGASACLIKIEGEEFLFKRAPEPEPEAEYRTLPQIFLEDFGIQLTKTDGEWESGEFWEKQDVVDAALLDMWQGGLYFFCDADGNMQQPQQNSELRLRKPSRLPVSIRITLFA